MNIRETINKLKYDEGCVYLSTKCITIYDQEKSLFIEISFDKEGTRFNRVGGEAELAEIIEAGSGELVKGLTLAEISEVFLSGKASISNLLEPEKEYSSVVIKDEVLQVSSLCLSVRDIKNKRIHLSESFPAVQALGDKWFIKSVTIEENNITEGENEPELDKDLELKDTCCVEDDI